jgi:hypothetical protein
MPPRRQPVEEALTRLRSIRDPWEPEARQVLAEALSKGPSVVVQRAAKIVADAGLEGFDEALAGAFDRLMAGGVQADAGCGGKTAIVDALNRLRIPAEDVFLRAIRFVQLEFGSEGPVDAAAALRAQGIVALAEMSYDRMLEEAVRLLVDSEVGARLGAVRALVADGSRSALLLLRMKALGGDRDSEIMYECLSGLLERDTSTFEFVASFLNQGWVGPAALALAASRRPEAFGLLKEALDGADEAESKALITALTMLRTDESIDYLIALLNGRDVSLAVQAYDALSIYKHDPDLGNRFEKAVKASKYRRLLEGPRRGWTDDD